MMLPSVIYPKTERAVVRNSSNYDVAYLEAIHFP